MYRISEPDLIVFDKSKKEYKCNLFEKDFFLYENSSPIENSVNTFIDNVILKDKTFINGIHSGAVGLVAKFGSGKSFFMHMLFCKLLALKDEINTDYHIYPVYMDISKYENNFQRLLILIFAEITKSISSKKETKKNKLEIIKTILPIAARLGMKLWTKKIPGIDEELVNASGEIGEGLAQYLVETLDEEDIYLDKLKKLSDEAPLVILIDNLDRCRPEFVLDFFVLMKRMFSVTNILFIVSYDKQQIINLLKTLYGNQVDISSYMRKYISFEFTPSQHNLEIRNFTIQLSKRLEVNIEKSTFDIMKSVVVDASRDFEHLSLMLLLWENTYKSTRLSLRQYQHGLALILKVYPLDKVMNINNEHDTDFLYYLFDIFIIYMKIAHPYQYQNFQSYLLWDTKKDIEGKKIMEILELDNNFLIDFENIIYSTQDFLDTYSYLNPSKFSFFVPRNKLEKENNESTQSVGLLWESSLEEVFEFYFREEYYYIEQAKKTILKIEQLSEV